MNCEICKINKLSYIIEKEYEAMKCDITNCSKILQMHKHYVCSNCMIKRISSIENNKYYKNNK